MARLVFENYDPNSGGYYNTTVVANTEGALPPGGAPGQILVKTGHADFDCDWMTVYLESDGTGGGGTGTGGDIILDSVAPIRVSGGGSAWTISIDAASQLRPGSMSAADKRRLDNLPCTIGRNPPVNPRVGDLWFDPEIGRQFIYYQDATSSQWVDTNPAGGSSVQGVYVGDVPPPDPIQGQCWFDTTIGNTFIYYVDSTSAQWVPVSPAGGTSDSGVYVGDVPPPAPKQGQCWFDTTLGTTFIWYVDSTSAQWVPASPAGGQNSDIDEGGYGSGIS
jgi:hypothetical protein